MNIPKGLRLFSLNILHLVSIGKEESFTSIEKCIDDGNTVDYLYSKYNNDFITCFDNSIYDIEKINQHFSKYAGYIDDNETGKYGIVGENNGLLVLLALAVDSIEESTHE